MSIPTIIVDDEPLARQLVQSLLEDDSEIQVVEQCANGKEALRAIETVQPALMFLDVRMPGLSGFDLLEQVDQSDMPYVIFITAYDKYAVRAFEIHALDYLLKPFDKERFYDSVNRAKAMIRQQRLSGLTDKIFQLAQSHAGQNGEEVISSGLDTLNSSGVDSYLEEVVIREGGRILAVRVENIVWLEAANQYLRIHTLSGSHLLSRSLDTLLKQLDPAFFFRIHRSAVVNAPFIKEVRSAKNGTYDIGLTSGKSLKLSRTRKHLLPQLLKYCS